MIPEVEQHSQTILDMRKKGWFSQYANLSDEILLERLDSETVMHELARHRDWLGVYPWEPLPEDEIRFCSLPDRPAFRGQTCKWPDVNVTWHVDGGLPGIAPADFTAAAQEAFRRWEAVCGIKPKYTANGKTANIYMHAAHLDGGSGVLADSRLPCGFSMQDQAEQRYDSERWNIGSHVSGKIELTRVICHELGHGLIGTDHIASGNLMAPTYSASIDRPQTGDIAEAFKRYGPPIPVTPPPTQPPAVPPSPPSATPLVLTGVPKGTVVRVPGYRVTPLAG